MKQIGPRIVGWLAGFFPDTYFYSATSWPELVRDVYDGERDAGQAAILTAIAAMASHRLPKIGMKVTGTLRGVTSNGRDIGHFRVTIERISEDAASSGEDV